MINTPAISIIMPCYNQAIYLAEALDSVLAQTYTNWECIIVNDGSPDDTAQIASVYLKRDERIKYLQKKNGGLSSARNRGIELAKSEFILPLDADDLIHEKYIETALKAFSDNPALSLVYCKAEKFGVEEGPWDLSDYSFQNLLLKNCIFCSAVYRKRDWALTGGYDELLTSWEDWDLWIKILNPTSLVYQIPEVFFYYRIKNESMLKSITNRLHDELEWRLVFNNKEKYQQQFNTPLQNVLRISHLEQKVDSILNSRSYKVGNFMLKPLSMLKNLFKK